MKPSVTSWLLFHFCTVLFGQSPGRGMVTDIEGNIYPTVQIGSTIWMAANLRSTFLVVKDSPATGNTISGPTTVFGGPAPRKANNMRITGVSSTLLMR